MLEQLQEARRSHATAYFGVERTAGLTGEELLWRFVSELPAATFDSRAFALSRVLWHQIYAEWTSSRLDDVETQADRSIHSLFELGESLRDISLNGLDSIAKFASLRRHFLPAYLRCAEGVFYPLLRPIAKQFREKRGVSSSNMSFYDVIEELRRSPCSYLAEPISRIVRNAIGHEGVRFEDNDVVFKDSRGNTERFYPTSFVKKVDELAAHCFGIALGLLVSQRSCDRARPSQLQMPLTAILRLQERFYPNILRPTGLFESTVLGKSQLNVTATLGARHPNFLSSNCDVAA